jgi:hypothetical protein
MKNLIKITKDQDLAAAKETAKKAFMELRVKMKTSDQRYQYWKIQILAERGEISWEEAVELAKAQAQNLNKPFWE